jgi:hypothetical protein
MKGLNVVMKTKEWFAPATGFRIVLSLIPLAAALTFWLVRYNLPLGRRYGVEISVPVPLWDYLSPWVRLMFIPASIFFLWLVWRRRKE